MIYEELDPKAFWRALGMRAVGAAIVTAQSAAGPAGFLALSATHLTAAPPIMMVSIGKKTSALAAVLESKHFAINYLPTDAQDLAREFGGTGSLKGVDRFSTATWSALATGAPVLTGAVGVLDCALEETIERYETIIALGRVVAHSSTHIDRPLIAFGSGYLSYG